MRVFLFKRQICCALALRYVVNPVGSDLIGLALERAERSCISVWEIRSLLGGQRGLGAG